MSKLLAAESELEKLIDNYPQALRLHPDDIEILLGLAGALARQGQYDEAVIHSRAAVATQSSAAGGPRRLGEDTYGPREQRQGGNT